MSPLRPCIGLPFSVWVSVSVQLGKEPLDLSLGTLQNSPDLPDYVLKVLELALVRGDDFLTVPLARIGAVVMVEEVVLPHGTHVSTYALAHFHSKLLQGDTLPFRCDLDDTGVDWMLAVIVGDMKLNMGA